MAKRASMSAGEVGLAKSIEARPGAVSRVNAEHYRWGHDCDAWHLVKDPQFTVIEELIPPGAAEVRHYHKKAQQFFYILSGEAIMEVEKEPVLIPAGSGLRILPGVWHQIRNPSSSTLRLLVISHPPSHGDKWTE
ncbi:MAG TPA: cupin domain-containing protein [Candidatus Eisenbacteria bacterium]|jgi:mannose-6-phosphate isomerase-like protein (cupin superfamily)|nr:cupin domain-containing protein [Candidatus Eisenbacteria bacterium]